MFFGDAECCFMLSVQLASVAQTSWAPNVGKLQLQVGALSCCDEQLMVIAFVYQQKSKDWISSSHD